MDRKNASPQIRNTRKYPHFPQELIEEILPALPAKSLLRFRCVSKSWRCLIDIDKFIKTQLEKSMKDPSYAHWRVAFNSTYHRNPEKRDGLKQCSVSSCFRSYMDEVDPKINGRPFDDSTNNHLTTTDCDIVGHCNGLLCILKKQQRLFLWNPTTRISIKLPKLDCDYIEKYGFGMDERTGAYKVFAVLHEHWNKDIGKVYSSETNSWKTVEHGCPHVHDDAGVLVGGKLHWLTGDEDYIESFDLSNEVFEMIEVPDGKPGEDEFLTLREASGRLSVIYASTERKVEWVRVTKGGANEHWVKVRTVRHGGEELKNILDDCDHTVYVESLISPVTLKNH